ncbi:MAG: hypothetical protein BWY17_02085 [Deltaproteobacteria bacterium ADurb.Bin207]|jgi:tetratricopeptide (TPR) repeat protein|nr:MAG: hypothetical protein BWY17_02085 [Deltaproteobacteria bacterium ADurb.Bin207]
MTMRFLPRFRNVVLFWAGVGAALVGGHVQAQERDSEVATDLFVQGREALKAGDLSQACHLFADSLRLDPAVGTALNLAECEERRGRFVQALRGWKRAVELAQATHDEREQVAHQRHDALLHRMPHLTVVLSSDAPGGTTVYRQGELVRADSFGRSIPLDMGEQIIVIRAPGHEDRVMRVMLAEGDKKMLTVGPGPAHRPVSPPVSASSVAQDSSSSRTLAYVLGGIGVSGLAAAAVTGVMLLDSRKTVDEHCDEANRCDSQGMDAAGRGRTLVPINLAAWAVGVVGVGAGTYLFLTAPSKPDVASGNAGAWIQVRGTF